MGAQPQGAANLPVKAEKRSNIVRRAGNSSKLQIKDFPEVLALERHLREEELKREVIKRFISRTLVEGTDYGFIRDKKKGWVSEKKVLFKPGAEKFCSLFKLKAEFVRDDSTLEMIPATMKEKNGVVAFICHLKSGEKIVAEGRGACDLLEKDFKVNTAIKIAQKRAKMDAVLSFGSISDSFTQDLEDEPGAEIAPQGERPPSAQEKPGRQQVVHDFVGMLKEINKIRKDLKWDGLNWNLYLEQILGRAAPKEGISWAQMSSDEKIKIHSGLLAEMKRAKGAK